MKFALLLFSFLYSLSLFAETNAAFTDYEKIAEAAFPPHKMLAKYSRPTALQNNYINATRDLIVDQISVAPQLWFSTLTGGQEVSLAAKANLLEAMKGAPVWICAGSCSCPNWSPTACVKTKRIGDIVASSITIDPCAFKNGCNGKSLYRSMQLSLATVAYVTYYRAIKPDDAKELSEKTVNGLGASTYVVDSMLNACPGPFPVSGAAFLRETGHLTGINEFVDACAAKLVSFLDDGSLSKVCSLVIDRNKWKEATPGKAEFTGITALRCDDFCETVTCGDKKNRVPRFLRFGSKWFLSVPEGSCDGAKPNDVERFVANIIKSTAKDEIMNRPGSNKTVDVCVKSIINRSSSLSKSAVSPAKRSYQGPSVELIE